MLDFNLILFSFQDNTSGTFRMGSFEKYQYEHMDFYKCDIFQSIVIVSLI